jgi:starvation-inducible DNA-binding protein
MTFETSIDVEKATRNQLNESLNQQLADSLDLYSQAKQAHWNVKGMDFIQLHELFDDVAAHAEEWIDLIAERVTILGGYAKGTARMAAEASRLPEYPTDAVDGPDHVKAVVERLAAYAATTRAGIDQSDQAGDPTTADLLTEISRQVDKDLWFVEAHLQS